MWGYVQGGMGMVVSFCDAAREAGAVVAAEVAGGRDLPVKDSRWRWRSISCPVVISNADPRCTFRLLGKSATSDFRSKVEQLAIQGCTVKLNVLLRELPNFTSASRPESTAPLRSDQRALDPCGMEEPALPPAARESCPSICGARSTSRACMIQAWFPQAAHHERLCAICPHTFATGSWMTIVSVCKLAFDSIGRLLLNIPGAVLEAQVIGPSDIEEKGRSDRRSYFSGQVPAGEICGAIASRLAPPMPGVYPCGACTHPRRKRHRDEWP